jgi:hypothetical protein
MLAMNKKNGEDGRKERERRKKKVYDGSDIFTQNYTIPTKRLKHIHVQRIRLAVRRISWKRKRHGFSLLFVLMQKYDDSCR